MKRFTCKEGEEVGEPSEWNVETTEATVIVYTSGSDPSSGELPSPTNRISNMSFMWNI